MGMDFHGVSPFHVDWSIEVKGMERVPKRGVNLKITYLKKKKFFQKIYAN